MFNDKLIEVWKKGQPVHIGGGVYQPGLPSLLYTELVDIQPYSSAEAKKEYGLDIITTNRMFIEDGVVEIGSNIIKYNDKSYEVKQKIVWDDYTEVLLEAL